MIQSIADCQVLIAGGMGAGAYESLRRSGIRPVLTDVRSIEDALKSFIENRLRDHYELIHTA
jgi:predicted Fe-Mo cluster-binding NifX family protein